MKRRDNSIRNLTVRLKKIQMGLQNCLNISNFSELSSKSEYISLQFHHLKNDMNEEFKELLVIPGEIEKSALVPNIFLRTMWIQEITDQLSVAIDAYEHDRLRNRQLDFFESECEKFDFNQKYMKKTKERPLKANLEKMISWKSSGI